MRNYFYNFLNMRPFFELNDCVVLFSFQQCAGYLANAATKHVVWFFAYYYLSNEVTTLACLLFVSRRKALDPRSF